MPLSRWPDNPAQPNERRGFYRLTTPPDHPRLPGLPVVIFPGNVSGDDALAEVYRRLALATAQCVALSWLLS